MIKLIEELTVCYVFYQGKVLLGMKKLRLGAGRYNGFGGHVEKGESKLKAAIRELLEESGLMARKIKKLGIVDFTFENRPGVIRRVRFFKCNDFDGESIETEEMCPRWFPVESIPYDEMWPSDFSLLSKTIANKKFAGRMRYDSPSTKTFTSTIIEDTVKEVKFLWPVEIKCYIESLFVNIRTKISIKYEGRK